MVKAETQTALNLQAIRQHEERINGMEGHIEIANKEMGELRDGINKVDTKVEKVAGDVDWLKRFFWIIATSSIGSLVAALFNIANQVK